MSNADEILKLKELLDENIITKDEFEIKKKELLGITLNTNNKSTIKNVQSQKDIANAENSKNEKTNSLTIAGYIIGALFLIAGAGGITSGDIILGLIYALSGLIVFPPFNNFLKNKYNINMSEKLRIIIFLILFFSIPFFSLSGKNTTNTLNKNNTISTSSIQNQKDIVLDINQFYNSDKTDTITSEELIALKGSTPSIEEWDYTADNGKIYPLVSYIYTDDEITYDFYNNKLYSITVSKEIPYANRTAILPMFGLSTTKDTIKTLDSNTDLRYSDCGVKDFWVRGFQNNTFCFVKIDLINLPV